STRILCWYSAATNSRASRLYRSVWKQMDSGMESRLSTESQTTDSETTTPAACSLFVTVPSVVMSGHVCRCPLTICGCREWRELVNPESPGVLGRYAGAGAQRHAAPAGFAKGRELRLDMTHRIHSVAGSIVEIVRLPES